MQTILPMLDDEGRIIWEPEAIIATQERRLCSRTLKEYLIRWKKFLDEYASWETTISSTIFILTLAFRTKRSKRGWQCYVSKFFDQLF